MEAEEHLIQAKGDQLEQLYCDLNADILAALHTQARRAELIFDPSLYSKQSALTEPNSFYTSSR